jgi:enoyl reductase-like protein
MNLLTPWIFLGVAATTVGVYFYGHHVGWDDRDAEMQIEIAKKNEEAREVERNMTSKVIAQTNKLQEANNALTQKTTALDRAIRAGRVRLPASCPQSPANSTAPSSDRDTETSESDRQTLAAIAAIVAEGDAAINQLNACIASYNEMRELVNGKR